MAEDLADKYHFTRLLAARKGRGVRRGGHIHSDLLPSSWPYFLKTALQAGHQDCHMGLWGIVQFQAMQLPVFFQKYLLITWW